MITGLNTEIKYRNTVFHIQTEDKGERNPIIETLIYVGGEIIDAKRMSYEQLLKNGLGKDKLRELMEEQHQKIIVLIKQGKYSKQGRREVKEAHDTKEIKEEKDEKKIEQQISTKSLDQVILDYITEHSKDEKLMLYIKGDDNLIESYPASLIIKSLNQSNAKPLPKSKIVIKIISTIRKPVVVFEGFTNNDGVLNIDFIVPEFPHGNAAIIIQGFSAFGNDEHKAFIKKNKKK
jgi:hypothetical protein